MDEISIARAPTAPALCRCKRPLYTPRDLARWRDEVAALPPHQREGYNPEWARGICWTIRGATCNMKALEQP